MKRILITGGTAFVSRFAAEWFAQHGYEVFVLNRGSRLQPPQTTLIQADRYQLGNVLKSYFFDAVLDITAYNEEDIHNLLDGLGEFGDYIFISSSAVYPETLPQPFEETQPVGPNALWGDYGINKIAAENYLLRRCPQAYILRPPYLYGPMQNLYREPFVFDCALANRPFCIPGDGAMPLHFFHVADLCQLMELILQQHPDNHILNVGNREIVDVNQFARLCYQAAGAEYTCRHITEHPDQRDFFPFRNYGYVLDVTRQCQLLPTQIDLLTGLQQSFDWYRQHPDEVKKRDYLSFIDTHFFCN